MKEILTYCDNCGNETKDGYAFDFKWCNDNAYHRFDICEECKEKSESLITDQDKVNFKKESSKDIRFLGLLRLLFNK